MMSYTRLLYHIIFSTKGRQRTIVPEHERELYAYVMGIIENAGGHLFRIGGMPDHIHLVVDIPSRVSLADFVKQIKQGSSNWLASNPDFANWRHWEEGYGAFTYAYKDLPHVVEYVKNQKIHHQKVSFADEYRALLDEYGIKYDERFMPR